MSAYKGLEVYVLISIEPKSSMGTVEKKLLELPRLYEVMEVLGRYEIMAKFKVRNKEQLVDVVDRISKVDGVKDYLVLVVTKRLK